MSAPQDSGFTLVWVFGFVIVAILAVVFFNQITPVFTSAFSDNPQSQQVFTNFNNFLPSFFSWVFSIVFAALPLMGLGLALFVRVTNFWWWVYSAVSILVLAIGWMFQSLYGWFTDVTIIGDAASQISSLSFIMDNYALYSVFVIAVIGFGTYYGKRNSSNFASVGGFR